MHRVVISGIGLVSPLGNNIETFVNNLKSGNSGIQHIKELQELDFRCQVGGICSLNSDETNILEQYDLLEAPSFLKYAFIAGYKAWKDSGLDLPDYNVSKVDYDTGIIIASVIGGIDLIGDKVALSIHNKKRRELRGQYTEQLMGSAPSAYLSKLSAAGNICRGISNACSSSTEAVIDAYFLIRNGQAKRMLAGGAEGYSPYYWGCIDALRILAKNFNHSPQQASRPMSASACGFVPASGSGVLVLEELNSALERNAPIYAEIIGGAINSGGHRNGGSMTAPNNEAIIKCIRQAVGMAYISESDISLISGHLTATKADSSEILNYKTAFGYNSNNFPPINTLKSLTGHMLGAAGAVELIASCLQMKNEFIHPNINCEDLHPQIAEYIRPDAVSHELKSKKINYIFKAGFGFGDVNSCMILKKYN
ncbi:MAG: beta-ketoacyl-[acyl-carrier-protein] synthase family protein [Bacteroidales bacterium]|nr:beta-ketoacyl-[acyl-carrier-protein] synthase family protein [Bacteroidales bacterium]